MFVVGTSTINAMVTPSFTISTIPTTASSDITSSTATNLCAVNPSSTACMMAIEDDDETGNDTIYVLHTLKC